MTKMPGVGGPAPAGIPPLMRRFWDFTKNTAKNFSKHLNDPEKREEEFIRAVKKDFEKWV